MSVILRNIKRIKKIIMGAKNVKIFDIDDIMGFEDGMPLGKFKDI